MRSLSQYLQQRIEQESKHDYWLFSGASTYSTEFLGALLLDAIFRPLSQYMNIVHATDLDYVANTDFEAVKYTATEIGIDLPPMEHIRKWNKFGNPATNMEDFAKLAFNEKRYKPAQQRAFIRRHEGLHAHLRNIYLILETVHRQISHMHNLLYVLKILYLFYITDRTFNLLNWHLFQSDEVNPPFISLFYYSFDELAGISQKKGIAKTDCGFHSINQWQREVIPAYNQLLLDVSFFLSADYTIWENSSLLFEDIVQWSYISAFSKSRILNEAISFLVKSFEKYSHETDVDKGTRKEYDGNPVYIETLYTFMLSENPKNGIECEEQKEKVAHLLFDTKTAKRISGQNYRQKITHEDLQREISDNQIMVKKHNIRKEVRCCLDDKCLDIISNPFLSFEFILPLPKNKKSLPCPLMLYKLPIGAWSPFLREMLDLLKYIDSRDADKNFTNEDKDYPFDTIACKDSISRFIEPLPDDIDFEEKNPNEVIEKVYRFSIKEWDDFFQYYCNIEEERFLPDLVTSKCKREEKLKCHINFLKRLREIYIQALYESV